MNYLQHSTGSCNSLEFKTRCSSRHIIPLKCGHPNVLSTFSVSINFNVMSTVRDSSVGIATSYGLDDRGAGD
jgi:hypothetical protein